MRIALVNDVMMAVEALRRVVLGAREHQVAWIAHDGAEAAELCARDRPDLILMDLIMPGMDGVEATRRIMARTPCADRGRHRECRPVLLQSLRSDGRWRPGRGQHSGA